MKEDLKEKCYQLLIRFFNCAKKKNAKEIKSQIFDLVFEQTDDLTDVLTCCIKLPNEYKIDQYIERLEGIKPTNGDVQIAYDAFRKIINLIDIRNLKN